MLTRIHTSHLEAEICLRKTRDIRYWPIINSEVKDFISNCTSCNDYLQNNSKKPLITHPIPSKSCSRIAIDIMTISDRNYLITAEFYTDSWELDTLPNNATAASII